MAGPSLDWAILFDICVALVRGRRLERTRGGRTSVAEMEHDGRCAVYVDGREILRGNAFEAAALWQNLVGWRESQLRGRRRV
jgi:hypothetical protein